MTVPTIIIISLNIHWLILIPIAAAVVGTIIGNKINKYLISLNDEDYKQCFGLKQNICPSYLNHDPHRDFGMSHNIPGSAAYYLDGPGADPIAYQPYDQFDPSNPEYYTHGPGSPDY